MAELLKGATLMRKDGSKVSAEEALAGKVVALYFSAHWCPPCKAFTPSLKNFYEQLQGCDFEIVFVSHDRSESDLKKYVNELHGNWTYLPFGSDEIDTLCSKYGVRGIPMLIVIKSDGTVITKNARADVTGRKTPKEVLASWKA